jgi:hypothetical protein
MEDMYFLKRLNTGLFKILPGRLPYAMTKQVVV